MVRRPGGTGYRWWDGRAWSDHVRPYSRPDPSLRPDPRPEPGTSGPATAGPAPAGPTRPGRDWSRVPFLRIGVLLIVTAFAAIAVLNGQDIRKIGLNGDIEFFSRADSSTINPETVRSQQPTTDQRVSELESVARNRAPANPDPDTVDLNGTWRGAGGPQYTIEQYQTEAVIVESVAYGTTAYGIGTVRGDRLEFSYQTIDGSVGRASLTLVDDQTLSGTFTNLTCGCTVQAELTR